MYVLSSIYTRRKWCRRPRRRTNTSEESLRRKSMYRKRKTRSGLTQASQISFSQSLHQESTQQSNDLLNSNPARNTDIVLDPRRVECINALLAVSRRYFGLGIAVILSPLFLGPVLMRRRRPLVMLFFFLRGHLMTVRDPVRMGRSRLGRLGSQRRF